ncbi:MAG TPA: penicillin acylase family protein [Myxococcota bacterium]|nr:penicillin acylase family protein [Myxococcota bacterium]
MLLLLLSCTMMTLMTQGRSLPELDGRLEAPGLAGDARIIRDERGIPHIRANSEADAAFAVGYAHAQDRLFQMDLARRLAYGEMSELLGADMVELDIFMRSLGLREHATGSLKSLDPDARFVLAAYAAGVNAGRDAAKVPPIEHRLLKERRVAEWTPIDSMAIAYLNSWWLSRNPEEELFAWLHRKELSREDLDALFRLQPETPKADPYWEGLRKVRAGDFTEPFDTFLEMMTGYGVPAASNNWAVSGERSADGMPILANDPHLSRSVPATWYILDAKGGAWHAAGGTVPGLPWVVVGHNETMAWGATNTMADYVDFVVLEREGQMEYYLAGEKKRLHEETVEIVVKDEELPRTATVYLTDVGPVVTELAGTHILAMRWSALQSVDLSPQFIRSLNLAPSVAAAREIDHTASSTSLNLVLADDQGDIGWQVTGLVPKRMAHTGRLPYPGSSEHHGWEGFWDELPGELNPERGYVATANDYPSEYLPLESEETDATEDDEGDPRQLATPDEVSSSYILPWRIDRIRELLEATEKHTVQTFQSLQMDKRDNHAAALVPELLGDIDTKTEGGAWVQEQLLAWDFVAMPRGSEELLWAEFNKQLVRYALEDTLSPEGIEDYMWAATVGGSVIEVEGGLAHFVEDTDMARRAALLETHKALTARLGESTSNWRWENVHPLHFDHPFQASGAPSTFSAGTVDDHGSSPAAVNPGGYSWSKESYETTWIASMRLVVPLSDVGQAMVVLPPGQSGQPGSDHYQDQLRFWKKGELLPLWFHDADVEREAAHTLELTP